MKNYKLTNYSGGMLAAVLLLAFSTLAWAGPAPKAFYRPIMMMEEAQKLPVGSQIAIACDNGGSVSLHTVDEDRSYLKGFTCPVTKKAYRTVGGRSGGPKGRFSYEAKGGYTAHLLSLGKN